MKTTFFKKSRPDPELLALRAELQSAQGDLSLAYRKFDQAVDAEPGERARPAPAGGRRGMDLNQKIIAALLAGFFLIALLRVFSAPLKLAVKLLANTLLGFLALWAVNATAGVTGIALGVNVWNALVIGVLGLPGFILLLLVQWVL